MIEAAPRQNETSDWLESLCPRIDESGKSLVERACSEALKKHEDSSLPSGERMMNHAQGVARIVADLRLDAESVAAAILIGTEIPAAGLARGVPDNAPGGGGNVLNPGVA